MEAKKKVKNNDDSQSSDGSDDGEFEPTDGAEDFEDYKVDGYHPVTLGEVFNDKYQIVQKLGWGHFSTVWLANEKKTSNYFALKIQKSKKSYSESAVDELEVLKTLEQNIKNEEWGKTIEEWNTKYNLSLQRLDTFNIRLFDNFCYFGMHGKHYCSVFEIMGPNLLDLIQFFEDRDVGMDIRLVKIITRQLLMGLDYLHRICNVIHTDLKPENIMVELHGQQLEEFIMDVKGYKKKPLSMKFLKKLQQTNANSKKKQQKKKLKKQQKKLIQQAASENGEVSTQANSIEASKIENSQASQEAKTEESKQVEESLNKIEESKTDSILEEKPQPQVNQDIKTESPPREGKKESEPEIEEETKKECFIQRDREDWCYNMKWKGHINVKLDKNVRIKIVDFGNGCWTHKHFTDNIQTREYRSPEALLGIPYQANTDIWSLACVVFEMLTSNFLFKPKSSEKYSKNDDHLALMIEHLGKMPKAFALKGKYSKEYFNKNGQLFKIKDLNETTIAQELLENELITDMEASQIEEFLLPMLEYDPEKRISAAEALKSEWLWT